MTLRGAIHDSRPGPLSRERRRPDLRDFPVLVLGISLPLSALFYRWVEVPAIRVGNRVCQALASRTQGAALPTAHP